MNPEKPEPTGSFDNKLADELKEISKSHNPEQLENVEPKSTRLLNRMIPEIRQHADRMEDNFQASKPYLFALADEVLAAYPTRGWKKLVGDDTSGRLPARFIRQAMEQDGIELPMDYIAASEATRAQKSAEVFDQRAAQIVQGGYDRILIIAESAAKFRGARFLRDRFQPHAQTVDFAFVTSNRQPPADLGESFVGGVGYETNDTSATAYENPQVTGQAARPLHRRIARKIIPKGARFKILKHLPRKVDLTSSAPLTNLEKNYDPDSAVAARTEDNTYRLLSAYCYSRMDELAEEYHRLTHNLSG